MNFLNKTLKYLQYSLSGIGIDSVVLNPRLEQVEIKQFPTFFEIRLPASF